MIPPGPMPRTFPDKGCAPTRPPRTPEKGILNEASVDKKTVRSRIGKSFAHHRGAHELRGILEASVASRPPFAWLNGVYLCGFRSHLQV
jgi:hypothetical protein